MARLSVKTIRRNPCSCRRRRDEREGNKTDIGMWYMKINVGKHLQYRTVTACLDRIEGALLRFSIEPSGRKQCAPQEKRTKFVVRASPRSRHRDKFNTFDTVPRLPFRSRPPSTCPLSTTVKRFDLIKLRLFLCHLFYSVS